MFFLFLIFLCGPTYKTCLLLSINTQYLTVLFCCGDLPRHRAMVLPFYSKLLVQFKELMEIIDIKCPLAY